ncbi:uncharacterized protein ACHE_10694A [Aspergillus chevalieri]|uniref:Uncharacterized protein n=1 Tax=Aspergillus chevalieri TaxID=182096 RepID=A0A7R7VEG2_ASPCH|nr:uncharacterized protein ACHE_10694A [Aspergillus chevalieri]BCR83292.1 hypothetical protein ACHE_10694A [Aspergillus chevalieri]
MHKVELTHNKRRRVWDCGFRIQALNESEPHIVAKARLLVSKINQRHSQPLKITNRISCYAFHVMGEIALGMEFEYVQRRTPKDIISWLIQAKENGDPGAVLSKRALQDAWTLVVAGSDMVSTTLTNALICLSTQHSVLFKPQSEFGQVFPRDMQD